MNRIRVKKRFHMNGERVRIGAELTIDMQLARALVQTGKAEYIIEKPTRAEPDKDRRARESK